MRVRSFVIFLQVPEALLILFQSIFSLLFRQYNIIFIVLSFCSFTVFCILSILVLISLTKLYIFSVVFFSSKVPIGVFFVSSISLLKLSISLLRLSFLFFICFKCVHSCLLIIVFYHGCIKIIVRLYSNITVISTLDSIDCFSFSLRSFWFLE